MSSSNQKKRARVGALRGACLALLLLAGGSAFADQIVYTNTVRASGVPGAPEFLTSIEMPFTASGNYRITTKDWQWFNVPLSSLSFGVFSSTGAIKTKQGAGVLEFFKAGEGKVFLQIYAVTPSTHFAGLIGVKVESLAAVVALPSSLLLLASVLGAGLLLRGWRREADPVLAGGAV